MNRAPGISESAAKILDEYFAKYVPDCEVWAYGSRTTANFRPQSDLDFVVFTADRRAVSALAEALDESRLPFRADIFIWDDIPESFKDNIRKRHIVLRG